MNRKASWNNILSTIIASTKTRSTTPIQTLRNNTNATISTTAKTGNNAFTASSSTSFKAQINIPKINNRRNISSFASTSNAFTASTSTSTSASPSNNKSNNNNTLSPPYMHITSTSTRTFKTWPSNTTKENNRTFQTTSTSDPSTTTGVNNKPGSKAFADCETNAVQDLFYQFAQNNVNVKHGGVDEGGSYLCLRGVRELLHSIGERPDERTLRRLFQEADVNKDGKLHLNEFLVGADKVLGGAPARIVLVVGGPGSGKGILCDRLAEECDVVHLSSGDLLRDEVTKGTPIGNEVAEIMKRGELVSSAVITALLRRRSRKFPGRRILLDGFPRSVENCHDFLNLIGTPELALHLDCDDTILMERIIKRGRMSEQTENKRSDDNVDTAIQRLRTYHKYHHSTMDWLRVQHVPIVNLDCSGTPENVWNQLLAIGRLMRPATQLKNVTDATTETPLLLEDVQDFDETPNTDGDSQHGT